MYGIQGIVEDVMTYEVPQELVQQYDIIRPSEHARLTEERNKYLEEIDAEISELENELALDPSQLDTLNMAMGEIKQPRSGIVATQAQFLADQAALEQDRRKMALDLLKAKRREIKEQILIAHNSSFDAARKCIREAKTIAECD